MTQTTITTAAAEPKPHPADRLLNLIIALLAPMFLGVAGGDIDLARMAAAETINAYRSRDHADLIAVAQIVAFGLAALGSLGMSMAEDLPLPTILRLRANASALNRAAEQNRRLRQETSTADQAPQPATRGQSQSPAAADHGQPFLSAAAAQMLAEEAESRLLPPAPARQPAPTSKDLREQRVWGLAMRREAEEVTASLPDMPFGERSAAAIRASALHAIANELIDGTIPPLAASIPARDSEIGPAAPW